MSMCPELWLHSHLLECLSRYYFKESEGNLQRKAIEEKTEIIKSTDEATMFY